MKVQCYGIFDSCSGIYEKPFFAKTDDVVRREFQDVANTPGHPINKHPEHYTLYRLGGFDNENGKLTDESNESLWTALEAISQSQKIPAHSEPLATGNNLNHDPMPGLNQAE